MNKKIDHNQNDLIEKVYVNRSINFADIKFIGFDMDHTLIPYRRENFERLAFQETLKKFIAAGYPQELSNLEFNPDLLIRGLLVDPTHGNLLKVDAHKYVKEAYHGHIKLEKSERYQLYNKHSFKAHKMTSLDTFFSLSEFQLFVEIVDFMQNNPNIIKKSFNEIFQDLRLFIDTAHNDNSIKDKVLDNPGKYFNPDSDLYQTLDHFIESGKSIFLLTNSTWEYTNAVMEYMFKESKQKGRWQDIWDVIIVGANKPEFFSGSQTFFEVIEDSQLLNIMQGNFLPHCVYHGGNARLFEKLTGYLGDEILYVGDHIYGDILQSKSAVNWRTALIVEELDHQIIKSQNIASLLDRISSVLKAKESCDEQIQIITLKIKRLNLSAKKDNIDMLNNDLVEKKQQMKQIKQKIKKYIYDKEKEFHPLWGELLRVGTERSRFASQVCSHACIYTSKVSNFRHYSAFKSFISPYEKMPHER